MAVWNMRSMVNSLEREKIQNIPKIVIENSVEPNLFENLSPRSWYKQVIRNTPVINSKYKKYWRRAMTKIRLQRWLGSLSDELNMYGSNVVYNLDDNDMNNNEDLITLIKNRSSFMESNENQEIPFWIISPFSKFKTAWNIVLVFLLIYAATIMPYRLAFIIAPNFSTWGYISLIIDCLFLVDIIINWISAYIDEEGELVTSRSKIFWKYFSTWLLIDVVSTLPFNYISDSSEKQSYGEPDISNYNTTIRFLRLVRLYRLFRVRQILLQQKIGQSRDGCAHKIREFHADHRTQGKWMKIFFTVAICWHIAAWIWYYIARFDGFNPDTWVIRKGYQDDDEFTLYTASLYWSMATMSTVGYGDVSAETDFEKVFSMLWMIYGIGFFGVVIGIIENWLASSDIKVEELKDKLDAINEFAEDANLDKDLRFRLRHSMQSSSEKSGFDWQNKLHILKEIPKGLRHEMALGMFHGAIKSIPFFNDKDQVFVAMTVPFLRFQSFSQFENIYKVGDHAFELYFLVNGRINLWFGEKELMFYNIRHGMIFGDIEMIFQSPRMDTAVAAIPWEVLVMGKSTFKEIAQDFPHYYDNMKKAAREKQKEYDDAKNEIKAQICRFTGDGKMDRVKTNLKTVKEFAWKRTVKNYIEDLIDMWEETDESVTNIDNGLNKILSDNDEISVSQVTEASERWQDYQNYITMQLRDLDRSINSIEQQSDTISTAAINLNRELSRPRKKSIKLGTL